MKKRRIMFTMLVVLILTGCNFPLANATAPATTSAAALSTLSGPGVQIVSPTDGAQFASAQPIEVRFVSAGGPFIEADLSDESGLLDSFVPSATDASPSGTLTWKSATDGTHTLTVSLITMEKQIYTASITVTVTGDAATALPQPAATTAPLVTMTEDPARAGALAKVLQIYHDTYGLNVTAPPLMRKYRYGVANDPWVSVVYAGNWMVSLEVYPDHVVQSVASIDMLPDASMPVPAGEKAIDICRPAGTLKVLVVFVDYQNLGVTKDQALAALSTVTAAINSKMAAYSTAGGASSPILQLQTTGLFLPSAPAMTNGLLTPEIVSSITGARRSDYDLMVQVDLDANNTRRKINAAMNFDTNGFQQGACIDTNLSIWMGLDTVDQALDQDIDHTFERILSHEILHTFGYPADHIWPAGDGSQPDATDQSDIYNWPTLMLGWTDTDGDGLPEIIDPTPYGMTK